MEDIFGNDDANSEFGFTMDDVRNSVDTTEYSDVDFGNEIEDLNFGEEKDVDEDEGAVEAVEEEEEESSDDGRPITNKSFDANNESFDASEEEGEYGRDSFMFRPELLGEDDDPYVARVHTSSDFVNGKPREIEDLTKFELKRNFRRVFDPDEESVPEDSWHLSKAALREFKESPISWSKRQKKIEKLEAIERANPFTSSEKIWRLMLPLSVAFLVRMVQHLSRNQLKKLFGMLGIVSSLVVKYPQIRALQEYETTEGISRGIEYCQILSFTISVMNGIRHEQSMLTWGDELCVFAQNMYLISLIWKFKKTRISEVSATLLFYAAYVVGMGWAIFTLPHDYLWPFQVLEVALLNPGYIPQIVMNNKNKHAGCLSGITQTLSVFIHISHAYINLADGVNLVVGVGYLLSGLLNTVLLLQIIAFSANSTEFIERELELSRMAPFQKKLIEAIATNTIESMFAETSEML
mmetsp:Transcript_9965/g.11425  ORF Transcript_9965/g.11425 Transcript_9965/m.11425 type:complete len:466 (-) Transcript_9965:120-1517(-)